jgi:hypothetical protein
MKLVGKAKKQRGKGRYEYIPEYHSAGFWNTDDVKHNTPERRKDEAYISTRAAIEARI